MAVTCVLSLLLVLVMSAGGSVGPSTNSSLCSESRECLQYKLLCQTDEYQVRHYSPTLWISTDAEAYFMGVGAAMAFRRLFQYIIGANEGGYQMDMAAPVLVKIPEETRMWEPAIYTLSFPLPQAYQEKPPQPTNDKLYFTQMPDMDVYVRSYGGWMLSVTSRQQAHQLTKELDRVGASYNHTHHYGVGYDSPLKLLNRHNEIWYVSEGKPVCSDPQEPTPPHPPHSSRDQTDSREPTPSQPSKVQTQTDPSTDQTKELQSDDLVFEAPHFSVLQADDPTSIASSNAPLATHSDPPSHTPTGASSGAPLSLSSLPPETPFAPENINTVSKSSQTSSTTEFRSHSTPNPSERSTHSAHEQSAYEQSTLSPSEDSTPAKSSLPYLSTQITPSSHQSPSSSPGQASPSTHAPLDVTHASSEPSPEVDQPEAPPNTAPEHKNPPSA